MKSICRYFFWWVIKPSPLRYNKTVKLMCIIKILEMLCNFTQNDNILI